MKTKKNKFIHLEDSDHNTIMSKYGLYTSTTDWILVLLISICLLLGVLLSV